MLSADLRSAASLMKAMDVPWALLNHWEKRALAGMLSALDPTWQQGSSALPRLQPLHSIDHDDIHDVTFFEWLAWTPLLIAIVVFGVYPQLMFKLFDPAVSQLTAVFRK